MRVLRAIAPAAMIACSPRPESRAVASHPRQGDHCSRLGPPVATSRPDQGSNAGSCGR
jgi:hypothetical protein